MKKTLIVLAGSFIFIFFLSSCKKTIANRNLTGKWQWNYSIGGVAGGKVEPEGNRKVVLTFNEDSTYTVMDQGTISFNGSYHITLDTTFGKVIHFKPAYASPNGEVYTIKSNQLILTDYMISDGFSSYYERIK